MESAAGPDIDCKKTIIGIYPKFEMTLVDETLKINSTDKIVKSKLDKLLEMKCVKNNNGFCLKGKKFSDIFALLSNT